MTAAGSAILKACPFCGNTPRITFREGLGCIACPPGSTCAGTRVYTSFDEKDVPRAIDWWNRRSAPAQDAGLLSECLEYVAAHHMHHHVISELPFVREPCARCDLVERIRAHVANTEQP